MNLNDFKFYFRFLQNKHKVVESTRRFISINPHLYNRDEFYNLVYYNLVCLYVLEEREKAWQSQISSKKTWI